MRRGIFGGTFDPIHIGHLILAEEALLRLPLDRVTFVPAGTPWRKPGRPITPAADRLAMVRLAVADNLGFDVSEAEIERGGYSYMADTLAQIAGAGEELFVILGADALVDLPDWVRPDEIVRLARIVVAARPGFDATAVSAAAARIEGLRERLILLPMPLIEVSATDLRGRARRGESLRYLVPEAVASYIRAHGLYALGSTDESGGGRPQGPAHTVDL